MSFTARATFQAPLPEVRIYHIFAGLVLVLLLSACQAPTVLPALTEILPTGTLVPNQTTIPTAQAFPRSTPSPAPTRPPEPAPAGGSLTGERLPVHYLPAPVCCLAADPFDLRVVYALLADGHFYVSADRGQTWQQLPLPHPQAIALEPPTASLGQAKIYASATHPGLIFVHSREQLLRSSDRGQTWQEVARDVAAWTVQERPDLLQLYTWRAGLSPDDHGLFRSSDQGKSWQPMYPGSFPPAMLVKEIDPAREGILSLALDPGWDDHLYAGTNYGLFRSKDGGRTWEPFEAGLPTQGQADRRVPLLLAGQAGGLYIITEAQTGAGGSAFLLARLAHGQIVPDQDSWELLGQEALAGYTGPEKPGFYGVFSLEKDPLDEDVLFLATAGGLFASRDAGHHWRLLPTGSASLPVYRVAAAPGVPTRLYLSTAEGFASQLFDPPGQVEASPGVPWPSFTPGVNFQVTKRIGGDLTTYNVDPALGQAAGMAYVGIGPDLVLMDVSQETAPDLWSSLPLDGELAKSIAVSAGRAYVLSGERTLREIDISNRANPRQLAKISLPNPASSLALHEPTQKLIVSQRACPAVRCQDGLRVFTISPGLRELAFLPALAPVELVEFVGDYAYAFEQSCRKQACTAGLRVIDLAAEPVPRQVSALDLPGRVVGVEQEGDHLYVAHAHGLLALDISDAAHPFETNPLDLESLSSQAVNGLALSQGYAYLNGTFVLDIFSLQDPDKPQLVKTWQSEAGYSMYDILAGQQALYIIETFGEFGYCDSHLVTLDLADPENPQPIVPVADSSDFVCASQPARILNRLYLVDWDGLHVLDLDDPLRPQSWSDYTVSGEVEGVVADQLRLFWTNWRASESLYGMDVSDPEHFRMAGPLSSTWSMDPALYWNNLFLPAWADGLKILDVSDYASPVTLEVVSHEDLGAMPVQAVLDGRYLYVVQVAGGLRVLDVADPSRPRIVGRFDLPQSILDLAIQGDYAYLLTSTWQDEAYQGEIVVIDVGDPRNPRRAGSLGLLPGEQASTMAAGRGWLYLGGKTCSPESRDSSSCPGWFVSYSVSDPQRPERARQLDLPQGVTDIALDGERAFLAAGPSGVWALDLSDPARPGIAGQQDIPSGAKALAVVFNRVYVAAGQGGLVVLDVSQR